MASAARSLSPQPPVAEHSSFGSNSDNLNLIRAVAVLSVFFAHLHSVSTGHQSLLDWHFAQIGVLTFFVHTSMVLMLSLERSRLTGKALFADFYLRRFFRLFPLSMLCVTVAMVLSISPDSSEPRHWTFGEYLANMTLTTNLTYTDNMVGGLWTLPLECQMYVVLPFLFLLGSSRPRILLFGLWLLSIPLALVQLHTSARLNVIGYVPCFLGGVIAWKLSRSVTRRFAGWLWPLGFVLTWPFFFVAKHDNDMYFRWAFCLALGAAIPWFKEISFRPVQAAAYQVAKYSYGIYLTHLAVMLFCFGLPLPRPAQWAAVAVLAVSCPVALYHVLEHPMILLGHKLAGPDSFAG